MPYFNAVMVCTKRGVMPATKSGYFDPARMVTGADALLIVANLKTDLELH
jgi:hypothetical protein